MLVAYPRHNIRVFDDVWLCAILADNDDDDGAGESQGESKGDGGVRGIVAAVVDPISARRVPRVQTPVEQPLCGNPRCPRVAALAAAVSRTVAQGTRGSGAATADGPTCIGGGEAGGAAPALQQCSRCRMVRYCGRECQAAHWPEHKAFCVQACPKQARSANANA